MAQVFHGGGKKVYLKKVKTPIKTPKPSNIPTPPSSPDAEIKKPKPNITKPIPSIKKPAVGPLAGAQPVTKTPKRRINPKFGIPNPAPVKRKVRKPAK